MVLIYLFSDLKVLQEILSKEKKTATNILYFDQEIELFQMHLLHTEYYRLYLSQSHLLKEVFQS